MRGKNWADRRPAKKKQTCADPDWFWFWLCSHYFTDLWQTNTRAGYLCWNLHGRGLVCSPACCFRVHCCDRHCLHYSVVGAAGRWVGYRGVTVRKTCVQYCGNVKYYEFVEIKFFIFNFSRLCTWWIAVIVPRIGRRKKKSWKNGPCLQSARKASYQV